MSDTINVNSTVSAFASDCATAVSDFHSDVDRIIGSENEIRKNYAAEHGGHFKPSDRITSDEGKAKLREAASTCREKVKTSYDKNSHSVMVRLAEPPSDEALRALQTLRLRKEVTPADITGYEETFGGKWHSFDKLLDEIAQEKCPHYKAKNRTQLEIDAEDLSQLNEYINNHIRSVTFPDQKGLSHSSSKTLALQTCENVRQGKGVGPLGAPAMHH